MKIQKQRVSTGGKSVSGRVIDSNVDLEKEYQLSKDYQEVLDLITENGQLKNH